MHRNFAQQISAVTQLLLSETNRPGVVGMVFAFGATDSNIGLPEIGVGPFFVRRRLIIRMLDRAGRARTMTLTIERLRDHGAGPRDWWRDKRNRQIEAVRKVR